MAKRIQRAYRNYVAYKNACATKIQKAFRHWLKTKLFLQLREYGHEVLGQRKERRRFSLLSMRRFTGNYLDIFDSHLFEALSGHEGTIWLSLYRGATHRGTIVIHEWIFSNEGESCFLLRCRIDETSFFTWTDYETTSFNHNQQGFIFGQFGPKEFWIQRYYPTKDSFGRYLLDQLWSVGRRFYGKKGFAILLTCTFGYIYIYIFVWLLHQVLHIKGNHDVVLKTIFKTEVATHIAWEMGGNISINVSPK